MTDILLDLDAARREITHPDGIPVQFKGQTFTLPAELPADVFDPFLSEKFDLMSLAKAALTDDAEVNGMEVTTIDRILAVLEEQPQIIANGLAAIKDAFALLFGAQEYSAFVALRPSFTDYARLLKGLIGLYGVGLGEAFASPASSGSVGATPSPIYDSAITSTPAPSGDAPVPAPASSESVA